MPMSEMGLAGASDAAVLEDPPVLAITFPRGVFLNNHMFDQHNEHQHRLATRANTHDALLSEVKRYYGSLAEYNDETIVGVKMLVDFSINHEGGHPVNWFYMTEHPNLVRACVHECANGGGVVQAIFGPSTVLERLARRRANVSIRATH